MPPEQDASSPESSAKLQLPPAMPVGTSSWSSSDWCGTFHPEFIDSGEMIRIYSRKLPTVEIDSTWYSMPNRKMIESWKSTHSRWIHLFRQGPQDHQS